NDPDIVLADEPTGALDTETGVAVMDLLKEIAQDRLVVMVTHNPELAEAYATRIVRLADGKIVSDTNPLDAASGLAAASAVVPANAAPKRRARMNFFTALGLSFNNLMTKKGRTFMTAFAGSIGIIGIAAILSLSNGVNNYIADTEEEALTSYPLTITKSSFDFSGLLGSSMGAEPSEGEEEKSNVEKGLEGLAGTREEQVQETGTTDGSIVEVPMMTQMFAQVKNNNLKTFKTFLDSDESGIAPYVHTIQYDYGIVPNIYKTDTSKGPVKLNPSSMGAALTGGVDASAFGISGTGSEVFNEMMDNRELLEGQMDVVAGRWPERYDECVLVLSSTGRIMDYTLYSIGYYDPSVMDKMTQDALDGKEVTVPKTAQDFSIDKALAMEFSVVPNHKFYQHNEEQGIWTDISSDKAIMKKKVDEGLRLKVVGVVKPASSSNSTTMRQGIAYTPELTDYLMQQAAQSEIVKQQQQQPDTDVFTGERFEDLRESEGMDFDFDTMFTVDEEALNDAFKVDTDAFDPSSMSIDPNALSIDPSAVQIDPNALQADPSALNDVFSEDAMRTMLQGAPQFSLEDSGITDNIELTDKQQKMIDDATDSLTTSFGAWLITAHPETIVPGAQPNYRELLLEYLQTPDAQKILEPLADEAGTVIEGRFNTAMQNYLTTQFAPYISTNLQQMMTDAGILMANQIASGMTQQMQLATQTIGESIATSITGELQRQMSSLQDAMEGGFSFDAEAMANAIQFNMTQEDLTSLLTNLMNADELSFDANLKKLGFAQDDSPESVSIYPNDFEAKESVLRIIDSYNDRLKASGDDESVIQYSDFAGVLMSSVTSIIDAISLVLIAFVSISLVVSSIMISIITYISVLERKKEIGILRAMGASKGNIANVFNAETIIEGLIAGVLAIAVVLAASVPVNIFVEAGWGVPHIMTLPWSSALILIGISVLLTFLAGLIPSQAASRRDPVEALRSE
ncbi:MAG: FtsX-like permease family protein, partial [Eggerthellaceae bacterium]|nr:FtsX-like permease family protein [Eggerthellaceae bacterium]